jgi:hypothetical protein
MNAYDLLRKAFLRDYDCEALLGGCITVIVDVCIEPKDETSRVSGTRGMPAPELVARLIEDNMHDVTRHDSQLGWMVRSVRVHNE